MLPPFPQPPAAPGGPRKVSIIITNHNYEAFLPAALRSALAQRGAEVEVIVVDDGSTDRSREIIARHEGQVRPLLQENRGQTAAFNAGFAMATGSVVIFLDADDELRPDVAAAVAAAFAEQPQTARVVFRLEVVDETGRPTGACVPSSKLTLPEGDVRQAVLSFPDDLAWPPTSGNAFAAWALRRVMPLSVSDERAGGDACLHPLIPMLGPVAALDRVGGSYRLHSANEHLRERLDVERSRVILRWTGHAHAELDRLARELGYGGANPRSVTLAAHRIVSLRLGGAGHPVAGDSRPRALAAGLRAALGRADVDVMRRVAYAAWFLIVVSAPRCVVRALAEAFLQPVRETSLLHRLAGR